MQKVRVYTDGTVRELENGHKAINPRAAYSAIVVSDDPCGAICTTGGCIESGSAARAELKGIVHALADLKPCRIELITDHIPNLNGLLQMEAAKKRGIPMPLPPTFVNRDLWEKIPALIDRHAEVSFRLPRKGDAEDKHYMQMAHDKCREWSNCNPSWVEKVENVNVREREIA